MRTPPRVGGCVLLAACVWAPGCSSDARVTGPVKGRVTLAGKPLSGVTVFLRNAETKEGVNVHTNEDGTYEIVSHRERGLPPGTYEVAIRPRNEVKSDQEILAATVAKSKQADPWADVPEPATDIPPKYHDPATSGLRIEVAPNENPPFDFDIPAKR